MFFAATDPEGERSPTNFPMMQLGLGDGKDTFGIVEGFRECLPELPTLKDDEAENVLKGVHLMLEASVVVDAFDPLVRSILKDCTDPENVGDMEHLDTSDSSSEDVEERPVARRKRRRKHKIHHSDVHHRRRMPRKDRYASDSLLRQWGTSHTVRGHQSSL